MSDTRTIQAVHRIAEILREQGGRALLVGGCVRDGLMGVQVKDYDLEVYGLSFEKIRDALSREFSLDLVGVSFGVMKVHHYDIDISLPRLESKMGTGHKGFDISLVPDLSFPEASARRDFTINAMMRDPLTDEFIDCWNGRSDLEKGILRHVSSHFSEDELRVLRCMQFASRFCFQVAPETIDLCSRLSQDALPVERIASEWEKLLLQGRRPSVGLRFLQACGWLRFYPELEAMVGCPQNPAWHPEGDVWEHTLGVTDAAATMRSGDPLDDLALMLAALCHDMGKPATTQTTPDGRIISHGHDEAGEEVARSFIERIWRRTDLPKMVLPLVQKHMMPSFFICQNAQARSYRRLALQVKRMDLLAKLAKADILGVGELPEPKEAKLARIDLFYQKSKELELEREAPKPLVLGRHLVARGMKPGPAFKQILDACFEAQLDGKFSDEIGGLDFLDNMLKR